MKPQPLARRSNERLAVARLSSDRGESIVWMLVALTGLILVIGLVFEVGRFLTVQREAQRVAFESSRAGAIEVSVESLYRSEYPTLDTATARSSAKAWAEGQDFDATIEFADSDRVIEVTVTRDHQFAWTVFGDGATITGFSRSLAADGSSASGL